MGGKAEEPSYHFGLGIDMAFALLQTIEHLTVMLLRVDDAY